MSIGPKNCTSPFCYPLMRLRTVSTLSVLCGMLQTPCAALDSPRIESESPVHLRQLAVALDDANQSLRTDFARVAISEMVEAYHREADLARQTLRRGARVRDLWHWSVAVRNQAREFSSITVDMIETTPIKIGVTQGNNVYLVVNGKPVILSNPRVSEQSVFEHRVVEQFCSRNRCEALLNATLQGVSTTPTVEFARWSFSDLAGPVCSTVDGLVFQFKDTENLRRNRIACNMVVTELIALARSIRLERLNGFEPEWKSFAIRPHPGSELHRVILNGDGDYLLLALPTLSVAPDLFRRVRPWLASKVDGSQYSLVLLNAERLLAPISIPTE